MGRMLLRIVLCSLAALALPCEIDLTTAGLPVCAQACPEWCWATVIGEMKEYYINSSQSRRSANPPPATPKCRGEECVVVSRVRNSSCCDASTECAAGVPGKACGNPSSPDEIYAGFQSEIPAESWVHMHGRPGFACTPADGCYPAEPALQALLAGGTPVARATHGHITVLAGCRRRNSATEYRVLDSLQDPAVEIWMNYSLLTLGPPPGQGDGPWQDTFYSTKKGPPAGSR